MQTVIKKKTYQVLHDDLRRQIVERKLTPGMALPSENQLADDYGVSRPTVRKALEVLEQADYIIRRAGVGSFVCDLEQETEKKRQRQFNFGTDLIAGDAGFYNGIIISGIKRGCEASGSRLSLISKNDLITSGITINGLVLGTVMPDDFAYYSELAEAGIPIAMINRFPRQPELAYFSVDYAAEAEKAVEYLLMLGHRDIAVVGAGEDNNVATSPRTKGWEQAFIRRGLAPPHHLRFPFTEIRGGQDNLAAFLQQNRVTAIFVTLGALISPVAQVLFRLGLQVPKDISVFCFDDLDEMQELLGIPVCYVKMPLSIMGRQAVEYLVRRNYEPNCPVPRKVFEASLVINSGCRNISAP